MNNLQNIISNARIFSQDGDLYQALQHNVPKLIDRVSRIILEISGDNDFASWHWIVEMTNGRFAYIEGECDYTGWECQSGVDYHIAPSFEEALELAPEDIRHEFEEMIASNISIKDNSKVITRANEEAEKQRVWEEANRKYQEWYNSLSEEEKNAHFQAQKEKATKQRMNFHKTMLNMFAETPSIDAFEGISFFEKLSRV